MRGALERPRKQLIHHLDAFVRMRFGIADPGQVVSCYYRGPVEIEWQEVGLVVELRRNPPDAQVEAPLLQRAADAVRPRDDLLDEILDCADALDRFGANLLAPRGSVEVLDFQFSRSD
jgi:hypothetical protein